MTNEPYVKKYDKLGECINPIPTGLFHNHPNRKTRREPLQKNRFYGNSKNFHLTVTPTAKYKRFIQFSFDKEIGKDKRILHYIERL